MISIVHSLLLQKISLHAQQQPDKTALVSVDGVHITYRELYDNILKAGSWLTAQGVKTGDYVMLSGQKEVEFVYLYFGAHLCGIINVVVDANSNAEHLTYIASVVKPALAIGITIDSVRSVQYGEISLAEVSQGLRPVLLQTESVADIMFTSGTTGKPKGVCLSHANISASAVNINGFIGNGADDIELLGLPICHSFGLGRLRCNMLAGATVVLHNGFANLKSVFSAFEKYKVTGFGMVPAVWAYIKRFSGERIGKFADQIHYIEIGSAAMPNEDKALLCRLFPTARICMHYGLTEASRALFMEFHEEMDDLSTAGRPASGHVSVKILDEDGKELPVGNEGELCIRGNMVTVSYYLAEDNDGAFTDDGYFRTGDWGELAKNGKFYLKARKKEIINVGGKKVSPVEIEDAIESLGVGECMCVAIPDPDGVLGEVPKALIVPATNDLDLDMLKQSLSAKLEHYKLPREYAIVKSIPKTASGKKQRTISNV